MTTVSDYREQMYIPLSMEVWSPPAGTAQVFPRQRGGFEGRDRVERKRPRRWPAVLAGEAADGLRGGDGGALALLAAEADLDASVSSRRSATSASSV